MKKIKNPTACIIIIGNEILSGRTIDSNCNYLCKELNSIGVDVIEVRTIRDDTNQIIKTINATRRKYDYIFTTGGIGPTHDDITSISIAKAFKVKLVKSKEAIDLLKKYYNVKKIPINSPKEKMALIPKGAELLHNPITKAAGFRIKNVFVMAGIPKIMVAMFKSFVQKLRKGCPELSRTITTNFPESSIAENLAKIQKKYKEIEIGSYPFFKSGKRGVNIVLRSKDKDKLKEAQKKINSFLE